MSDDQDEAAEIERIQTSIREERHRTAVALWKAKRFEVIARQNWRNENERRASLGVFPLPWSGLEPWRR